MKSVSLEDLKYLDEVDILYPKPKKIKIGEDYVIIKELPLNTLNELSWYLEKLRKKYPVINEAVVPTSIKELNDKTEEFGTMIEMVSLLLKKKSFRVLFVKMLKLVMPEIDTRGFITSKYILKSLTETEAIQIIVAVFVYNFASDLDCKKKVKEIAEELLKE